MDPVIVAILCFGIPLVFLAFFKVFDLGYSSGSKKRDQMQRPVTRTAPVKNSTADASNGIPLSEFVKGADPNKPGQSVMYRLFDVFFQQYSDLLDILSFEKNDVCRSEILAFMHFFYCRVAEGYGKRDLVSSCFDMIFQATLHNKYDDIKPLFPVRAAFYSKRIGFDCTPRRFWSTDPLTEEEKLPVYSVFYALCDILFFPSCVYDYDNCQDIERDQCELDSFSELVRDAQSVYSIYMDRFKEIMED